MDDRSLTQLVRCFGVTYEGLKQVVPLPGIFKDAGFGVTYEGLKLGSSDNSVHAGRVLELPMRV